MSLGLSESDARRVTDRLTELENQSDNLRTALADMTAHRDALAAEFNKLSSGEMYRDAMKALDDRIAERDEARAQLLALGVKFNAFSEAVKATHLAWTEGADFNLAKRLIKQAYALS